MVTKENGMTKKISLIVVVTFLTSLFQFYLARAADNPGIQGSVRDAQTGDPLPSASVVLVGTSFGAATDVNGAYIIRNVPPGSYTLRVSYIGYKNAEESVEVKEGENLTVDLKLEAVAVQGEVVTVTAQARGQKEAINEQLASKRIVNVVSAARIQELPDANAAEAVGRLPGVSILRSGGEGNEVVIRGLQPKYNAIMIDGVRMASSDPNDRSTDLSMISPYMLEGIEVSKTVTPDQDADVLGGTVNFKIKEAGGAADHQEGLGVSLLAQGGYNGLSDAYNKYNNYKFVASAEGRFFESALGVFAQADLERRNLTSNEFGASYDHAQSSTSQYVTTGLNLNDIPRDRQRGNATLVLDYRMPQGKVSLMNFVSSGTTEVQNRSENFNIQANQHSYTLAYSKSSLTLITNALDVEQQLPVFHADLKLSHTYSETKDPNDWSVNFLQSSAGLSQFINKADLNPQDIPKAATNDFASTFLNTCVNNNSFSRERALTASLDLDSPLNLEDVATILVKFGGKYRYQTRLYTYEQFNNNASFGSPSARIAATMIRNAFPLAAGYDPNAMPIIPFTDPNFSYGSFLGGSYSMVSPLNLSMMAAMARLLRDNAASIQQQQAEGYARNNLLSTTNNYSGHESQSAAYIMATINIGPEITLIPGVRYQNLQTTYVGSRGIEGSLSYYSYNHYDTTVTQNHGYWLPDVALRYKPFSWFDVRLSYTNTVAYPDYNAIIPRIDVATASIAWNNYKLVPSRSTNYDAYLSFYDNTFGLFTVGGFLKQIDGLIYPWSFYVSGAEALPYFPPGLASSAPSANYSISTFVNDSYRINDWGLEFDWQTHLWYLPGPLSGLVLSVNYTHIFSKAEYPFVYSYKASLRSPVINVDTSFTDRLLYQPDDIVNLSVGYDYAGFSVRVSMLYQADVFTGPNFWPQLRTNSASYKRWDLSVKQELPWFGLQVYGDINNINGADDIGVVQASTKVPQTQQSYGPTADLGLRWRF
jgi:TonB-dependent receptor